MNKKNIIGLNSLTSVHTIALAGNPNTGKSTIFNALTGLKQHTGNWPGKTVARAQGFFSHNDKEFKLVDLPGTYSLLSDSPEEEIARDYILFEKPEITIIVVDATSLERNLNLVLQILEISNDVIVCLNLIDEAKRKGIFIDEKKLSKELGVPVIPTVANRNKGLEDLKDKLTLMIDKKIKTKPLKIELNKNIESLISKIIPHLKKDYPTIPNKRWIAMQLLEGDKKILSKLETKK